jgi:hypothetical protein
MKKNLGLMLVASILLGGVLWLSATQFISLTASAQAEPGPLQSIELIKIDPSGTDINQPAALTVTAQVGGDSTLLATSVNLLRYNDQGVLVANLGRMYDDGTNGDSTPGDNVFTFLFTLSEAQPMMVILRASVAYRGLLRRVVSNPAAVFVRSTVPAEQTLSELADNLVSGNVDAALKAFTPSLLNREALEGLNSSQRADFASSLRSARLVDARGNVRIYQVPLIGIEGGPPETTFSLARTELGEWVIMSW